MSMLRSADMLFVRLIIGADSLIATFDELGRFGKLHLENCQMSVHGENYMELKRRIVDCNYWERKLVFFKDTMVQEGIRLPDEDLEPADFDRAQVGDVLVELKNRLLSVENTLVKQLATKLQLTQTKNEAVEKLYVLELCASASSPTRGASTAISSTGNNSGMTSSFLEDEYISSSSRQDASDLSNSRSGTQIYGVIPVSRLQNFKRMLFRVSRGNAFVSFVDIPEHIIDPVSNELVAKAVFSIMVVGNRLLPRLEKVCQFFGATVYEVPTSNRELVEENKRLNQSIAQTEKVIEVTQVTIKQTLNSLANSERWNLRNWAHALKKEKAITEALQKCKQVGRQMTEAEGWVPLEELENLRACLDKAVAGTQLRPAIIEQRKSDKSPPTYFNLGPILSVFQGIVNTYGVPRYKEVNPGLFTVVTFPFLFGMMYGDIGHGSCLAAFGAYCIYHEKGYLKQKKQKKMGELFGMAFGGRYLLFAMGVCAVYCGTIYNDLVSIPLNLFGSTWTFPPNSTANTFPLDTPNWQNLTRGEAMWDGRVYPYGVDPHWLNTKNELTFMNSLKMKMAVTVGVLQMTFGICLSCMNHVHFGDNLGIFFEFIPHLVFMMCTFGYMCFMIIVKMCTDWPDPSKAPNLIQTMINMFLKPGGEIDQPLFPHQSSVQVVLLLLAFVSIPIMLLVRPCVENRRHKRQLSFINRGERGSLVANYQSFDDSASDPRQKKKKVEVIEFSDHSAHGENAHRSSSSAVHVIDDEPAAHGGGGGHGHGDGPFSFSDSLITSAIHTIEFVLGCISNTASYLRLWALSLAHAELSQVFWSKMLMQYGVNTGSPIMMMAGFGAWTGATVAVLLCMDVLECFLHALRLHWVEFQNKFFYADGYVFNPFTFEEKEAD